MRPGDNAAGARSQRLTKLDSTPPGARKAAIREVMEALRARGQVAYPPSATTHARPGYSVMAYKGAAIHFGSREGGEGACTRAHPGGRNGLAQRARVGNCPCCTRPTHVAVPTRYAVGEFSKERARGLALRTEHGPWAAQRCSASIYAQHWGYLPQ